MSPWCKPMWPTLPRAPRRAEQKIRSSGVVVSCLQKSEGFGSKRAAKDFNRGRCGISATPLLLHLWGAPKASSGREETRAVMSRRPIFHIDVFRRRPSTSCARVSCLVRIQSSSCANAPMSCGQQRSCWPQDDRRDACERSPATNARLYRGAQRRIETGAETLAQRQSTQGFSLAQARCKRLQNARARRLINTAISAASARLRDPTGAIPRAVQGRHGHGSSMPRCR